MGRPDANQEMKDALAAFMSDGERSAPRPRGDPAEGGAQRSSESLSSAYGALIDSYSGAKPVAETPADPPAGKQELVAAYDKLVEHEDSKPTEPFSYERPVPAWRRYGVPIAGILAVVATGYLGMARPAWLYPAPPIPPMPTNAAAAEKALIAGAIVLENFRAAQGRYPASFKEAGIDVPWMSFVPSTDGGFSLMTDAVSGRMIMQAAPGAPYEIERLR